MIRDAMPVDRPLLVESAAIARKWWLGLFILLVALLNGGCVATPPQSGVATFKWPDGSSYSGEWRNSQPFGRGVFIGASGQRYEGSWAYGLPDGQGTYTWPDGRRYTGSFQRDAFHGRGVQTWPSGERYEGTYERGEITGSGVYRWPNGDRYEGQFMRGLRSGQGTFTWADGGSFIGSWKDDQRDGSGVEYSRDGAIVRSGQWSKNQFVSVGGSASTGLTRDVSKASQSDRIPSVVSNCLGKGLKPGTKEFSACIAGS